MKSAVKPKDMCSMDFVCGQRLKPDEILKIKIFIEKQTENFAVPGISTTFAPQYERFSGAFDWDMV